MWHGDCGLIKKSCSSYYAILLISRGSARGGGLGGGTLVRRWSALSMCAHQARFSHREELRNSLQYSTFSLHIIE